MPAKSQVLMSGGGYSQNFNSLADSGSPSWVDNSTLPGWYISKSTAPNIVSDYTAGPGSSTTGAIYSFGAPGSTERALGSIASGSSRNFAYGVRLRNNTPDAQTDFRISCTGEQWRNGGNTSAQTLEFSYRISDRPITNSGATSADAWTRVPALDFVTPTTSTTASALDGNVAANEQIFTNVELPGVMVEPGQEMLIRWLDTNDSGYDHGMAVDNLTVSFQAATATLPVITMQPQSQAAGEGGFAVFSASAAGVPRPAFQWRFNGTNLTGQTNSTLALTDLTTNQAGGYSVIATNSTGATNSLSATLVVMPNSFAATNGAIQIMQYNVKGNGVANWHTNTGQAQAIGRQLVYLNPDVVTFNEIPTNGVARMPDWMEAFLPGFYLATNSTSDGYIQSVIASRFPITRSASHLQFSSLAPYRYTGTRFTRDLFEAEIAVPNWPLPLHVFVAHLKATGSSHPQEDADKRAAMASAISNYFVNVFLPGPDGSHPYVLAGDMNEDAFFPDTDYVSSRPIQRLTSPPTGLRMTIPVNPITHTDLTESIQYSLDTRFDYILPCGLLFSNIAGGEVFRTDLLTNFPPNLFSNDDKIASDHLPVLMVFKNPFDTPFRLLSVARTNQHVILRWESQTNRVFNIETSTNLLSWTPFASNIATATNIFTFNTNLTGAKHFFRIYRVP
ncbi:MAG TPA: immunoglobulin domain-containing protein [Verrucomicrobiae bacterium]|nr:immunoglobulin domain-containing protein [Verrucomicrobiae bacterium]